MKTPKNNDWTIGTSIGRWASFGPYYAMFPVPFARDVVERFTRPGETVLDPFCGRGTVPFVAGVTDRSGYGIDASAVAWVYGKVKSDPEPDKKKLLDRLIELQSCVRSSDSEPENEFQYWAWSSNVLALLNSARRNLDWRRSRTDRTLMGFFLVYLHGKRDQSLSNQMRQSKAMAPQYSVNWWRSRLLPPPVIDPVNFIEQRVNWRYSRELPSKAEIRIYLGRAENILQKQANRFAKASLLLTSPPYCGVTNYTYDNWIRHWLLGGPALPDGCAADRFSNKLKYDRMLRTVFERSKGWCEKDAFIYVRTDARPLTRDLTLAVIRDVWPEHHVCFRPAPYKKATQTALFGDHAKKPGEIDILLVQKLTISLESLGFRPIDFLLGEIAA